MRDKNHPPIGQPAPQIQILLLCLWLLLSLLLFFAHQHKAAGGKLSKMLNNGCNDFLFGVHCVEECPVRAPGLYYYCCYYGLPNLARFIETVYTLSNGNYVQCQAKPTQ